MFKKFIVLSVYFSALTSCDTEKANLSPFSESYFTSVSGEPINIQRMMNEYNRSTKAISYASEMTNLLAKFPKFKNEKVNKQISVLKTDIHHYIYAYEAYNQSGKERHLVHFSKSSQKLQNSKNELSAREQEILNLYLAKIKTNMSSLESSQNENSASHKNKK